MIYQTGGRTPSPKGASRVGLCGRGGANSGGGGDAFIGPRALETLGTPLRRHDVDWALLHVPVFCIDVIPYDLLFLLISLIIARRRVRSLSLSGGFMTCRCLMPYSGREPIVTVV